MAARVGATLKPSRGLERTTVATAALTEEARHLFARNVRDQRGDRTQEKIEASTGLEQSRLSRVERAQLGSISYELLFTLCESLDCLPSELFKGFDALATAHRDTSTV